jgi:protein-L-isoaspartate(D-aspartate) O-methyltransferase
MRRRRDGEALARAAARFGVRDQRVLTAVRAVPRELFVPARSTRRAYRDVPVPIGRGQTTSQPSLVAGMIAALQLRHTDRVLEVGAGHGYQTALLARLAAEVWSVERFDDLAEQARANLEEAAVGNATVVVGDGTRGLPERAPFGGIVVAAAAPEVPPPLAQQLADGRRLVMPIVRGSEDEVVVFERRGHDLARIERLTMARFVRLHGAHAPA